MKNLIFFSSLKKALSAQSLHTCNSMASEVIEKNKKVIHLVINIVTCSIWKSRTKS